MKHYYMDMTGYTKLFGSIVASTIWRESHTTRLVWITMLAMADRNGVVGASIPGLADMARVTLAECKEALAALESPDEYSRTPDHQGRRIEKCDGGWAILNHAKYREKMSEDQRREYFRKKKQEYRSKNVQDSPGQIQESTQAEAKAEASPKAKALPPPAALPVRKKDSLPTSSEAIAIANLFHRRLTTHWTQEEIRKFKELRDQGSLTTENMRLIEAYYAAERAKPEDKAFHRRDMKTFLINFPGELDRAIAFAAKSTPPKQGDEPEGWQEFLKQCYPNEKRKEYRYAQSFVKNDFAEWVKSEGRK